MGKRGKEETSVLLTLFWRTRVFGRASPPLLPCSREGRGGSIDNSRVTSLRRGEPKKKWIIFLSFHLLWFCFLLPARFCFIPKHHRCLDMCIYSTLSLSLLRRLHCIFRSRPRAFLLPSTYWNCPICGCRNRNLATAAFDFRIYISCCYQMEQTALKGKTRWR